MNTKCTWKHFIFSIMLVLSLTLLLVSRSILDIIVTLQINSHPLTGNSVPFQPHGIIRMGVPATNDMVDTGSKMEGDSPCNGSFRDDYIARKLSKEVKILIWVMTCPENLKSKALAVKETWGKRSNIMIYFSSESNTSFPTIGLGIPEGRNHLTGKTMAAFRYIYEYHFHDADWFMKADDDTYIIVENLRFFLSDKKSQDPIYYGHLYKPNVKQGYYSGGSGYIISKEALHRFGTRAVNSTICREDGGDEDVEFGICMEKLNVKTSISMDNEGRSLFHPMPPQVHLLGKFPPWHYRYTVGLPPQGFNVSKYAVSFHQISPDDMRILDYYFYHIRPYGVHYSSRNCSKTKMK